MLGFLIFLAGFSMCWAFEDYQGSLIAGAFFTGLLIGDIYKYCDTG
jgi:Kef-type K+ transport system membrane component KefB